ncbi:MAG: endonuclease/exonuclease/phosphatase family protein [Myxococcota bacterium]
MSGGGSRGRGSARWGLVLSLLLSSSACTDEPPGLGGSTAPSDDRLLVLPPLQPCVAEGPAPESIRVASWNISAGRRSSLSQVQAQLEQIDADVLLLQELDVGTRRTNGVDQPRALAEALGMDFGFAAALEWDGGDFGLAVLSRLPFFSARRVSLDSEGADEPRIVFDVRVCAGSQPLRLLDVHADFLEEANLRNLEDLRDFLGPNPPGPIVVAGDFNAVDEAPGVQAVLSTGLVDLFSSWDPGPTRQGERIDFVFVDEALAPRVLEAGRVQTDASDHTPLWIDLQPPVL